MDVFETVKQIIKERSQDIDVNKLTKDDNLTSLGLDSLDLVEALMSLEEQYNIEFTSEEMTSIVTLGDISKLIESKIR